jgi:phosphopantothenoylcysteine decarboxylase/phosphopantothenate--cysteine ligase
LAGKHVVVTAGPTHEDIDPVRYIGNRSSGKMGFAVAEAAARAGARVTLVAGPVNLETPAGVHRENVRGAREMLDAVMKLVTGADVFIGVAAVADYTPESPAARKVKKGPSRLNLELVSTPDIVAAVAALENRPFTVGFAAETENLRENALEKLSRKRLDMIAANRVGQDGLGFESENNEILILTPGGDKDLGKGSKQQLARLLIDEVVARIKGLDV